MPQSQAKATTSRQMAKVERGSGRHGAGDQRPALGALHQAVDVAVDVHVDGVGAAGRQRCRRAPWRAIEPDRGQAPGGDDQGGHGGDQQQLDDPRLGESDVCPDARPQGSRSRLEHRATIRPVRAANQGRAERVPAPRPGRVGPAVRLSGVQLPELSPLRLPACDAGRRCGRSCSSWSPARPCGSATPAWAAPTGRPARPTGWSPRSSTTRWSSS